jgi:hypothetical protein
MRITSLQGAKIVTAAPIPESFPVRSKHALSVQESGAKIKYFKFYLNGRIFAVFYACAQVAVKRFCRIISQFSCKRRQELALTTS